MKTLIFAAFASLTLTSAVHADVAQPLITPRYSGANPNEWTMDYDAALEKAAELGIPTIVMFTGSWWCPWCQPLERDTIVSEYFNDYLATNNMMLVSLDFNQRGNYTFNSTNKWFLGDPEYLTANGLTAEQGLARLHYNEQLQMEYSITDSRNIAAADQNVSNIRVGYPTWVLLDSQGNRRARLQVALSQTYVNPTSVVEMVRQGLLSDPADEMDNYYHWQPTVLDPSLDCDTPLTVSASLSAVDKMDYYQLTTEAGSTCTFSVAPEAGATGMLALNWYEGNAAKPAVAPAKKKSVTFSRDTGVSVAIPQNMDKTYFVEVASVASSPLTDVAPYSISCSRRIPEIEVAFVKNAVSAKESTGYASLSISINRNGRTDEEVSVNYYTVASDDEVGNAAEDEDFEATSGTLTWAAGNKSNKTIRIPLIKNGIWKGNQTFTVVLESSDGCDVSIISDTAIVTILESDPYKPGTLAITSLTKGFTHREGQDFTVTVSRTKASVGNADAILTLGGAGAGRFSQPTQTLQWTNGELGEKTATFTVPATDTIEADAALTVKLTSTTPSISLTSTSFSGTLIDQAVSQTLAAYVASGNSPLKWKSSGSRWFWNDGSALAPAGLSTDTLAADAKAAVLSVTPGIGILAFSAHGQNGTLTANSGGAIQTFTLSGTAEPVLIFSQTAKAALTLTFTPSADGAQVTLADMAWYPLTAPVMELPQTKSAFVIPAGGREIALAWTGPDLTELPEGVQAAYWLNETNFGTAFEGSMTFTDPGTFTGNLELRVSQGSSNLVLKSSTFTWSLLPEGASAFTGDFNTYTNSIWFNEGSTAAGTTINATLRRAVYDEMGPFPFSSETGDIRASVVSGKLPAGMKIVVKDGSFVLAGSPTAVGSGNCLIQVETKPADSKSYVKGETIAIFYTVLDLPEWAKGTFHGQLTTPSLLFGSAVAGGTSTMTVSKTGSITGKYIVGGKTYSFKASGFETESEGYLIFSAPVTVGRTIYTILGGISASGSDDAPQGHVSFIDAHLGYSVGQAWQQQWTLPGQNLASYAGYYTFVLADPADATGFGYLTATISNKGAVKLSGKTTDGETFSASTGLVNIMLDDAFTPMFTFGASPSAYKGGDFSGRVLFAPEGTPVAINAEELTTSFTFATKNPKGLTPADDATTGRIVGGWFTKNEDLAAFYQGFDLTFDLARMPVFTTTQTTPGGKVTFEAEAVNPSPAGLPIGIKTDAKGIGTDLIAPAAEKPVKEEDGSYTYGANTAALTAKIARATGILSGTLTAWYDYAAAIDAAGDPIKAAHTSKKLTYGGIWIQNADPADFGNVENYPGEKQINGNVFFGSLAEPRTRIGDDSKSYTVKEQIPVKIGGLPLPPP